MKNVNEACKLKNTIKPKDGEIIRCRCWANILKEKTLFGLLDSARKRECECYV